MRISYNEFHVSKEIRDKCDFSLSLFSSSGNVIIQELKNVRIFAEKLNKYFDKLGMSDKRISAGQLNAMGLIDEILHYVSMLYRKDALKGSFEPLLAEMDAKYGKEKIDGLLTEFSKEFPPVAVYRGELNVEQYLSMTAVDAGTGLERTNREQTFEEMMMLNLANENQAFLPFSILFNDKKLSRDPLYKDVWADTEKYFKSQKKFGPFGNDFINFLREPMNYSPTSLRGQLDYIMKHWLPLIGTWLEKRLLGAMDTISEEEKAAWHPTNGGSPDMAPYSFENLMNEYERFSADSEWMPKVVLMAKTVLVWLDQLTKKYGRTIDRLDLIPDEELDLLRDEGFTGLWLIGLWERSNASKRIKQICGNPEAAASAYSLMDYNIAGNLGGWDALDNLRRRLWKRGIRLASDMVPNHTGMDARWVVEKPDLFVQRRDNPFPQYTYNGENLSHDGRVGVYLEDHYYSKNDCAVVFKRVDHQTGDTRYIYHGNDGTGMPWNDTAQIDFLNPEAREAVMQEILHVARNFPIIRFDAAMVLAKKHIRRLWYPEPGHGGDIATRSETGLSTQQFNDAIPEEFWREVVDRVAREVPDTLLLAEAFWMMEGYFVRTLGMHRVYNSAFMNMLKKEENQKYRETVKNTITFDPQVLKRYVNFMNNPDEETAVAQFGNGDKYFGVCTLMITMPGLPMFGHGQIEGYTEKYGMEYTKAYKNETPDQNLVNRHWHDIFPLMKKRYLFAGVENFLFYDLWENGHVNENVFAYSNGAGNERAIVFYNNKYERATGWIKQSNPYAVKINDGTITQSRSISEGLNLTSEADKFMIFQEHKSGLWFVRRSSEICEKGMFVSLNGFESQVLMNIQQVTDDASGKYRILCDTLQGRGCEDLEIEWQEICYREIYAALENFAGKEFFTKAVELFEKGKAAQVKKFFADNKENALSFYTVAEKFILEDAKKNGEAVKKTVTAEKNAKAAFTKLAKLFDSSSELYAKAAKVKLTKADKDKTAIELLAKASKAGKADSFLNAGIAMEYTKPEVLIAQDIVFALSDAASSMKWNLARKFTQYFMDAGISVTNQRAVLETAFTLISVKGEKLDSKNASKSALKIVTALCDSPISARVFGTNNFNNIIWFNKEKSDAALYLFTQNELLDGDAKNVLSFYRLLSDAKDKSEYKSAELIAIFTPKKKPAAKKVTSKKTAEKKAPAKKTETKKTAVKKTEAKKPAAKKEPGKKAAEKKAPAKKPETKKTAAKKTEVKKPAAKKEPSKKAAEKKAPAKKPETKKKK